MKAKQTNLIFIFTMTVVAAALLAFTGCGGGSKSGGAAQSSGAITGGGDGRLAATVKLTGRVGGRMAAQSPDATVNVTITITGVYSGDNKEFPAISTTYPINLAQGYAKVTVTKVPTGVNHLLTAVADWGDATETVKVVIPEIRADVVTTATADMSSTVAADAAILYAQQKGYRLADVPGDTIASIGKAVASYMTQVPCSSMTPESVLNFMGNMDSPAFLFVTPSTANVVVGEKLQFIALLYDANNMLMPPPFAAWSVFPLNAGSITSGGGLLTPGAAGDGVVTVSYAGLTAAAEVSVISVCESDIDCVDGIPLTLDVCNNPGNINAACSHAPIACNTRADCNDNNALTLDGCSNGGDLNSACSNTTFACNDGLDCDDNNVLTLDVCANGGAANAACSHNAIACNIDADCNDNNAQTTDTCADGGALFSVCAHSAIAAEVTDVVPLNNAAGVAINTKITAVFSDEMAPATINTTTFTLKQGATAVSGTVTYAGVTATFTPASGLSSSAVYTATITTGAKDIAGNALATSYTWSFTTGAATDTTAPMVTGTLNANGAANVAINAKVGSTFTEPMDPLTINTTTFTLKHGGTTVAGVVSYTGVNAIFIPTGNLAPDTLYTATISAGARDLAGNAMASDFVWSWTTGSAVDTTPPAVTHTVPANAGAGAPIGNKLTATFSEAMNPITINTITFILKRGTAPVAGVVTYSGVNAIFTPSSSLSPNTLYTATISAGARDLAGNAMATNFTWNFTTGAAPDTTAPTITGTINANGATNVSINTKISATFSEAMDPLTINTTTYTMKQGTMAVPGTVSYSGVNAVFAPLSHLSPNTLYTVSISAGARDLAGNAMATSYTLSWTTGADPDATAPAVTYTFPANGDGGGTPIGRKLTATFNKAMDPLTITTRTFTLRQGSSTAISGTVTYSGMTAVFAPYKNLAPNALYTATITTGAKDAAGNALAADYVWRFTTASGADATAPAVTRATPANGSTGACVNMPVSATFSEAMDPLTVNTAHFMVAGVTGTVAYNAKSKTAAFTPANNLAPNTLYTATITAGVKDLSGNPLAVNKAWSFTTGASACVSNASGRE